MFTVFDSTTGEIISIVSVPDADIAANIGAGQDYATGYVDFNTYYIDVGTQVSGGPPQTLALNTFSISVSGEPLVANSTDELTFSNIPTGTEVRLSGPASFIQTVDDGSLVLTFNVPGDFVLEFKKPTYAAWEYSFSVGPIP